MNDINPNVEGYVERILRLAGATFLVPIILYTEWMFLVPVPFYVLVTVLSGYDPLKALMAKRLRRKKRQAVNLRKSAQRFAAERAGRPANHALTHSTSYPERYGHQRAD